MSQHISDVNNDGVVDQVDAEIIEKVYHTTNQTILAWAAMVSMLVVTLTMFTPFVTDSRIVAMKDILEVFYIAQASVIGFFMGASTYLNVKSNQ